MKVSTFKAMRWIWLICLMALLSAFLYFLEKVGPRTLSLINIIFSSLVLLLNCWYLGIKEKLKDIKNTQYFCPDVSGLVYGIIVVPLFADKLLNFFLATMPSNLRDVFHYIVLFLAIAGEIALLYFLIKEVCAIHRYRKEWSDSPSCSEKEDGQQE